MNARNLLRTAHSFKNPVLLIACLISGLWLAEQHVQPTRLSDAFGLESENFLVNSQREQLARASQSSMESSVAIR